MKFLETLNDVVKSIFNIRFEISTLREQQAEDRKRISDLDADFERLAQETQSLRERLVRLETQRDSDRAEVRVERAEARMNLERFKLEIERAMLRAKQQKQKQIEQGDKNEG